MSRYVDVTARLAGGSASSAGAAITRQLAAVRFPSEYYFSIQGQPGFSDLGQPGGDATSWPELASFVIAALLGILLLAQATFGSWRLSLLTMATLPLPVATGALAAFAIGAQDSLAAAAGLLGVLGIAIRQAFRMVAAIRGRPSAGDGEPGVAASGVAASGGPAGGARAILASMAVTAAVLLPFVGLGEAPGNELLHIAAVVILAGLMAATLVNLYVLPAAVLALGPPAPADRPEEDEDEDGEVPARAQRQAERAAGDGVSGA
jgi:Cu/Ag efflux pump CusA